MTCPHMKKASLADHVGASNHQDLNRLKLTNQKSTITSTTKDTNNMISIQREIDRVRGKACQRVIRVAARNDTWNMARYAAINRYFAALQINKNENEHFLNQ